MGSVWCFLTLFSSEFVQKSMSTFGSDKEMVAAVVGHIHYKTSIGGEEAR